MTPKHWLIALAIVCGSLAVANLGQHGCIAACGNNVDIAR